MNSLLVRFIWSCYYVSFCIPVSSVFFYFVNSALLLSETILPESYTYVFAYAFTVNRLGSIMPLSIQPAFHLFISSSILSKVHTIVLHMGSQSIQFMLESILKTISLPYTCISVLTASPPHWTRSLQKYSICHQSQLSTLFSWVSVVPFRLSRV